MPSATLQSGDAKGKKFKAVFEYKGDKKTYQFGAKGSKIKPWTEKAKNFRERHGIGKAGMSAKDYLNKQTWAGKSVGDKVSLPAKFFKSKKSSKSKMK